MMLALVPHRSTPSPVSRIEVEAARVGETNLTLCYRIYGDLERIRLPEPPEAEEGADAPETAEGRSSAELWRHTCLEAFIRAGEDDGYLELNFAPSIEWAAYRFTGYRAGQTPANVTLWELMAMPGSDHICLTAEVELGRMARPDLPAPSWRVGLSAVIEDVDGRLSYWALAHPSDKPDFHHPDSFVLELP